MTSGSGNYCTFVCHGTTEDKLVDSFEVKAIVEAYQVQVRVANAEGKSILFDATSRRWGEIAAGRALLSQVLASQPVSGLRLRLPTNLVLTVLPATNGLEIVDCGITTAILESEVAPVTIQHGTNQQDTDSEGEYEIDEDLEDEFAETQQY